MGLWQDAHHADWRALHPLLEKCRRGPGVFEETFLGLPSVDVGGGWLIFGFPPAEVAVHPGEANDVHEFYLMCEDVEALIEKMQATRASRARRSPDQKVGLLTQVSLPGGGKLGILARGTRARR